MQQYFQKPVICRVFRLHGEAELHTQAAVVAAGQGNVNPPGWHPELGCNKETVLASWFLPGTHCTMKKPFPSILGKCGLPPEGVS